MKQTVTLLLFTLVCGTAMAQNYVIEYESPSGFRRALQIEPFDTDRLDFNGDGTAELTLLRVDQQDNPAEMDVIDINTRTTLWTFDVQALAAAGLSTTRSPWPLPATSTRAARTESTLWTPAVRPIRRSLIPVL